MHITGRVDFLKPIRFTEVMEAERLEYEHGSGEEEDPAKFNMVVTFEDMGAKPDAEKDIPHRPLSDTLSSGNRVHLKAKIKPLTGSNRNSRQCK